MAPQRKRIFALASDHRDEALIQAAAHLGAVNLNPDLAPSSVTRAAVISCYDDGSPAIRRDLPWDTLEENWKMWKTLLFYYWVKKMMKKSVRDAVMASKS